MNWRNVPIKRKLTLVIVGTCFAALVLACGALGSYHIRDFLQTKERDATVLVDVVGRSTQAALVFHDEIDAQQKLQALVGGPGVMMACIYSADGKPFARYIRTGIKADIRNSPPADGLRLDADELELVRPVLLNEKRIGTILMRSDLRGLYDRVRVIGAIVCSVLVGGVLASFALASWLQRPISQPILALTQNVRNIAESKDYNRRLPAQGRDETGSLTEAFNQLLSGIGERDTALRVANESLRSSEAELQALNLDLEQRVQERTRQLEAANKEMEAFSYSVSHDLRAPLRHVQGYVEMLNRATEGQLSDKARRYLKTISDSSVEMGQLIDDLLAFSRMGRVELQETRVSLDALIQDTVRSLEMAINGRNIAWKIRPLPPVLGDTATLKQVMANLIGNAVKYSRQRDPAEIEIGCGGEEDGRAVLFVRDNGAGFSMKYVDKLFGVFQRLHRAEEFEGTGIGLATVRRIIGRHGGRTWAEGALNEGATFYFTLKKET